VLSTNATENRNGVAAFIMSLTAPPPLACTIFITVERLGSARVPVPVSAEM
jgi:hypothetical protein